MPKNIGANSNRVPEPFEMIQVNHCKNPTCPNFGVPASTKVQPRGRHADPSKQDGYIRTNPKGVPYLYCKYCGVAFPIKSNQAIYEEKERAGRYGTKVENEEFGCTNPDCSNFKKPLNWNQKAYRKHSKTEAGSQRYVCKGTTKNGQRCGRTFSVPTKTKTTGRQRKSHINRLVFRCLVNRNSINGMADIFEVDPDTIAQRIEFIYQKCSEFLEIQEAKLLKGQRLPKLYLSVDRQFYTINWRVYEDRRNSILYGLAAVDNTSGYVFAMDTNYEPTGNYSAFEALVLGSGDYTQPPPFRRFARFWLEQDFQKLYAAAKKKEDAERAKKRRRRYTEFYPTEEARRYAEAAKRKDIELADHITAGVKLPNQGLLVRNDYHMYGFFRRLRELVGGAEKLRFFMDQESGIRAACISAFLHEIRNRKCDAFYVQIARGLRRYEKETERDVGKGVLNEMVALGMSPKEARLHLIHVALQDMDAKGPWDDRWFVHPLPTVNEPRKKISHLTDFGDIQGDHRAWLYNKASLHGVNRYFAHIRMKLVALARGLPTATSPDRIWTPFNPYDPSLVHKLLLIHRVYFNFIERRGLPKEKTLRPGNTKRLSITPAMRLGIANSPYTVDDILYSTEMAPSRRRGLKAFVEGKPKSFLVGPEPQHLGVYTPHRISLRNATRMGRRGFVYLDTETTGTTWQHAIVEIAVVDDNGHVLLNTLVKPPHPIPPEATNRHGITDADVANSPEFSDVVSQLEKAVRGKYAVMYNARFDTMFLPQSVISAMIEPVCCMERFTIYAHEAGWVENTERTMSLIEAVSTIDSKFPGRPHRALPDALACRQVWRHMFFSPKPKRRIPQAFVGI